MLISQKQLICQLEISLLVIHGICCDFVPPIVGQKSLRFDELINGHCRLCDAGRTELR